MKLFVPPRLLKRRQRYILFCFILFTSVSWCLFAHYCQLGFRDLGFLYGWYCFIPQAAGHHGAFACSNGWNLPELRNDGAMALHVRDLTPYYLPRAPSLFRSNGNKNHSSRSSSQSGTDAAHDGAGAADETKGGREQAGSCLNNPSRGPGGLRAASSTSFDMDGLFLLTGENMAGKSTLCRSTLALALLANAGLFYAYTSIYMYIVYVIQVIGTSVCVRFHV